ncbi:MAG: leucine-rich repeat protein [Alistipes sp.]|nr:leucine-rich repeat protein [Alistipes sp.]
MKRFQYILFALVLMVFGVQCTESIVEEATNPEISLTLEVESDSALLTMDESGKSGEVNFDSDGGEVVMDIVCNQAWNYEAKDAEWLSIKANKSSKSNTLTLNADANNSAEVREATVTISAGKNSETCVVLVVKQAASETPGLAFEIERLNFLANTNLCKNVAVITTCADYKFVVADDWLSVEKTESGLAVTVEENTATKHRESKIVITSGEMSDELIVYQEGIAYRRYVLAEYNGGVKRVAIGLDINQEWTIVTSGEEWFSAKQVGNELEVTIDECPEKLERKGSVTISINRDGETVEKSCVVWQTGTDTEELIYEVETTRPNQQVIAAPILTYQNGGKMTVDFGDGSEPGTYEGQRVYKEYAEPGVYTIIISGEDIHNLEFAYQDKLCPELKRIHSWGKTGYQNAANMCKGCINLESIPADVAGSFADVNSFLAAFLGCEKLKEIPEGLFQHATKARRFCDCFRYTASISEIPENLFEKTTSAEEFYGAFWGAGTDFVITEETMKLKSGENMVKNSYPAELEHSNAISNGKLRSIPENLFSNCPNVVRFEYIFRQTAIESIPEKIFAKNSAVTNYEGVCYACTNLQSIPAKLMENATAATNIKYMFAGCVSLTEIPVAMFENCTEVTNLEYLFNLTGVKSLKKGIFKGLSKVQTVGSVFQNCTSLTDIEEGVFDGLTSAKSFMYCFADCTSLRTIPAGLLAGMSAAYDFVYMFKNTALDSVPAELFDQVRDESQLRYPMADYSYIFSECSNLKTVPATLFDHVTKSSDHAFGYLFTGSGIETIPAGLFETCTQVPSTAFEAVFMGCLKLHTIEGSIFPETTTITSMRQMFCACPKLVNIPADLFKPFGTAKLKFTNTFTGCTSLKTLPEGLFSTCTKATHFTGTFTDCTALESLPADLLSACGEVKRVERMFLGCKSLKTLPESLFAGCPKIETFEETFAKCSALETIPEKLFSAIGTTTTSIPFSLCFYGCSSLKSLPAGLFGTVRRINFIEGCFAGCTSLTGESPYTMIGEEKVHLYERVQGTDFPRVPSSKSAHEACFAGCSGLTDYANMPEEWR